MSSNVNGTGPCFTFDFTPPLLQLPFPLGGTITLGLSFPPAAVLATINNAIPCCHFNFAPWTPAIPLGLSLTPAIMTINATIKAAYVSMNAAATAAGIPSVFVIPKCPW